MWLHRILLAALLGLVVGLPFGDVGGKDDCKDDTCTKDEKCCAYSAAGIGTPEDFICCEPNHTPEHTPPVSALLFLARRCIARTATRVG